MNFKTVQGRRVRAMSPTPAQAAAIAQHHGWAMEDDQGIHYVVRSTPNGRFGFTRMEASA